MVTKDVTKDMMSELMKPRTCINSAIVSRYHKLNRERIDRASASITIFEMPFLNILKGNNGVYSFKRVEK